MLDALQVAAVVPSKMFFSLDQDAHSLHPLWMVQGRQPALQRILNIWESISALQGVAAFARRAFNLGQDLASLAGARWYVIGAFRHLAWS